MSTQPQLPNKFSLHKGCFFQRTGPEAIRVWRRSHCYECQTPVTLGLHFSSCTDDKEPLLAGLWRVTVDPPPEGYYIYSGSMPLCGTCARRWKNPAERNNGGLREPFRE